MIHTTHPANDLPPSSRADSAARLAFYIHQAGGYQVTSFWRISALRQLDLVTQWHALQLPDANYRYHF